MTPERPGAWRSPVLGVRGAGFLPPLGAVLAGLLVPAGGAFVFLRLAGTPGIGDGPWLRDALLLWLTALFAAPLAGALLLPVLWALALALAASGWAGLLSVMTATLLCGLLAAHVLLHGDVTIESPGVMPILALALAVQGWVVWAVFWGLVAQRRRRTGAKSLPSGPSAPAKGAEGQE